jgi:hypothetical protein
MTDATEQPATAASLPDPPRAFQVDLSKLPGGLKPLIAQRRWIVWRWELAGGRWTKGPYQSRNPTRRARSNDPTTWGPYADSVLCFETSNGQLSGIGFMLAGSGFAAIDIDRCFDVETGEPTPWATALVERARSYTERTVGGAGLRIIGYSEKPPFQSSHRIVGSVAGQPGRVISIDSLREAAASDGVPRVEVFRRCNRYITVSGLAEFGDGYQDLVNIDDVIDAVEQQFAKPSPTPRPEKAPPAPTEGQGRDPGSVAIDEAGLHPALRALIRDGVAVGQRSSAFYRVVGDLKELGRSIGQIEELLAKYPRGIAEKYIGRLRQEIERCYGKTREAADPPPPTTVTSTDEAVDFWAERVVPKFPMMTLPVIVREFVEVNAASAGFDPAGLAMAALATLSAAIDHRTKIRMVKGSSFWVPPNLWVLLVGDPGSSKSPIMQTAVRPLQQHAMRLRQKHHDECRAREEREATAEDTLGRKPKPKNRKGQFDDLPPPPEFVLHDVTPEKLGEILARDKRGVLIFREEVAGLIGGFGRYSSGRPDAARSDFLRLHDGGPWTVRRMTREDITIENFSASFLGGIQPDKLAEIQASLQDDGLLQRFVPIMVRDQEPMQDDIEVDSVDEAFAKLVITMTTALKTHLIMTDEGFDEMKRQLDHLFYLAKAFKGRGTGLHAALKKLPKALGALTMILHMTKPKDPDSPFHRVGVEAAFDRVEAEIVTRAATIVMDFIVPHLMALYEAHGGAGLNEAKRIASYLLTSGKSRITASDLTRNVAGLRGLQAFELNRRVSVLVVGGWLTPEGKEPIARAWTVNPGLEVQFAERRRSEELALQELARLMNGPRKPRA